MDYRLGLMEEAEWKCQVTGCDVQYPYIWCGAPKGVPWIPKFRATRVAPLRTQNYHPPKSLPKYEVIDLFGLPLHVQHKHYQGLGNETLKDVNIYCGRHLMAELVSRVECDNCGGPILLWSEAIDFVDARRHLFKKESVRSWLDALSQMRLAALDLYLGYCSRCDKEAER